MRKPRRIGITDYTRLLGDVVYVELPEVGDKVVKGKAFGSVESVSSIRFICTVSGTVVEVNGDLGTVPVVNENPMTMVG